MDAYQAGQQLGTLLFGGAGTVNNPDGTPSLVSALSGNAPNGGVYYRTLAQGAQAQNAMQEARANRAKALIQESMLASRQKLPAAIGGVYTNPNQAALADAVLGSNSTVNLGDLGKLQNPNAVGALAQAATDMNAGNFPGYDQQTALAAGKPYNPVTITGTSMLPTGGSLGDVVPTPVGQADIGAKNAQAIAAQALANLRDVKTSAGGFAPGKSPATKPSVVNSAMQKLLQVFDPSAYGSSSDDDGQPSKPVIDPIRTGQRVTAFLAAHPYGATEADAAQWAAAHPVLGGTATSGTPAGVNFIAPPAAPASSLGDVALGAPAPGTAVQTNPADAAGAAAASALASVDPTHALSAAQRAQFNNDPRVLTLQQQATKAITAGHADPARVAAKLQQEYSAIGYGPGASGG